MAAQGESSCWSFRAPQSSDSEPKCKRTDATSGEEQLQSADEESPPASQTQTSAFTPSYWRITGTGTRPGIAYPFSRWTTLRQSPAITRTPSMSTPQQFPLTPIFDPIELSSLGILPTDKAHRITDEFNTLTANVFNPVTLTEPKQPIEPENKEP